MPSISNTYNPRKPYSIVMKGRPDESASWQAVAVYSKEEENEFLRSGWKRESIFMRSTERARERDN